VTSNCDVRFGFMDDRSRQSVESRLDLLQETRRPSDPVPSASDNYPAIYHLTHYMLSGQVSYGKCMDNEECIYYECATKIFLCHIL